MENKRVTKTQRKIAQLKIKNEDLIRKVYNLQEKINLIEREQDEIEELRDKVKYYERLAEDDDITPEKILLKDKQIFARRIFRIINDNLGGWGHLTVGEKIKQIEAQIEDDIINGEF